MLKCAQGHLTQFVAALVIVAVTLHLIFPPRWLLDVKTVRIEDGVGHIERTVAGEAVYASWSSEIIKPNGHTCSAAGGPTRYERDVNGEKFDRRSFPLRSDQLECLVPGAIYETVHRPYLLGVLPLRRVETRGFVIINAES